MPLEGTLVMGYGRSRSSRVLVSNYVGADTRKRNSHGEDEVTLTGYISLLILPTCQLYSQTHLIRHLFFAALSFVIFLLPPKTEIAVVPTSARVIPALTSITQQADRILAHLRVASLAQTAVAFNPTSRNIVRHSAL